MFPWFAGTVLSLLQILVAVGLGYHYLLLAASVLGRETTERDPPLSRSFAIAIPAHNEAAVLKETLRLLRRQSYPAELFDVFIAADHCKDDTARVARKSGVICYERNEGLCGRKAYALQWLLKRILLCERQYDAIVVFDADSQVDPGFLQAMNRSLSAERPVLQGRHVIARPEESSFTRLADVDMRLNNLLRNRAKQNLGLSCRLMGDAMCFSSEVIRRYGWPADSLGEDREYGLYLLTQGIRVGYVPDAVSVGQAAPGWRAASTQRLRWYGGVLEIQRKFALRLLGLGFRRRDWAALDKAIELLLPSFSLLTLLSVCLVGIRGLWPSLTTFLPVPASVACVVAWVAFPFLGLWADGAPASSYGALLYSPLYMLWRLGLGFRARVLGEQIRWIRTRRREEA